MYSISSERPLDPGVVEVLRRVNGVTTACGIVSLLAGSLARDILLTHVHGMPRCGAARHDALALAVESLKAGDDLCEALCGAGGFYRRGDLPGRLVYRPREQDPGLPIDLVAFRGPVGGLFGNPPDPPGPAGAARAAGMTGLAAMAGLGHIPAVAATVTTATRPTTVAMAGGPGNGDWPVVEGPPDIVCAANVASYGDVEEAAAQVRITRDLVVAVVSLPGLTIRRLFSWQDRWLDNSRDAEDLLFLMRHYARAGNADRIGDLDEELLGEVDNDPDAAGAILLGRDVAIVADATLHAECTALLDDARRRDRMVLHMARLRDPRPDRDDAVRQAARTLMLFRRGLALRRPWQVTWNGVPSRV